MPLRPRAVSGASQASASVPAAPQAPLDDGSDDGSVLLEQAGSRSALCLAYDDGMLPPRNLERTLVPELDMLLVPALHQAARDGKRAVLAAILHTEQEDVNGVDPAHQTALHYACGSPHPEALEAAQALVAAGADPSRKDFTGSTPLHNAVRAGRQDLTRFLLSLRGSSPVIVDSSDVHMDTPLHLAVRLRDLALVQTLLEAGADYHVLNADNLTPPMVAKEAGDVKILAAFMDKTAQRRLDAAAAER